MMEGLTTIFKPSQTNILSSSPDGLDPQNTGISTEITLLKIIARYNLYNEYK